MDFRDLCGRDRNTITTSRYVLVNLISPRLICRCVTTTDYSRRFSKIMYRTYIRHWKRVLTVAVHVINLIVSTSNISGLLVVF